MAEAIRKDRSGKQEMMPSFLRTGRRADNYPLPDVVNNVIDRQVDLRLGRGLGREVGSAAILDLSSK